MSGPISGPKPILARFRLLAALCAGLPIAGPAAAEPLFWTCNGCHGPDGISRGPHIPTIAGLNFQYFYATMQAFRKDRRQSSVMGRIAKGYKSGQLQRMALHFGSYPWVGTTEPVDPERAQRGRVLHAEHCEECHEQNGHYQDKETPPLAGQAGGYLLHQMQDYRKAGSGMQQPPLMQERLEKLSDADLMALGAFYASDLTRESAEPAPAEETAGTE
ncbi:c-type cytochrome [Thiohalocapsa marina]|uniref:C-type cytochrome n=2 Tax=Thiohalocapsa marina TaxID=424902 RepID=A0A5M8FHT9_9GAMM|nr:c-type cytochrome [Thiohalocapsa marina]KAA6184458.1 c-type cytochrome [Thiohalocapsa marina]